MLTSVITFMSASQLVFAVDPVRWLEKVDRELGELYADGTLRTWIYTLGQLPPPSLYNTSLTEWKANRCTEASFLPDSIDKLTARAVKLICRGPLFTPEIEGKYNILQHMLREMYKGKTLCRTGSECYRVEPDLVRLMKVSRNPELLEWAWEGCRRLLAEEGLKLYPPFLQVQNQAARYNGYHDMGECWREELEIDDLENEVDRLLSEVAPLHKLLHGFVRHRLRQHYGPQLVSESGPIPAHLLGNMWAQSWDSLLDILINTTLNLDGRVKKLYKNVTEMALEAERFYVSIGLEPMTEKFWKYSVITKMNNTNSSCHGTAANLFSPDDYRILLCGSVNWEDFYVIHHEMGHVQYYMAYKDKPTYFKEAANSAFQEAIGDTIMLAVETPDHLRRLGVVEDNEDIEIPLLLHQALKKIPHIAFGFVVDKWRWGVMASNISTDEYNKAWWEYRTSVEGVKPPIARNERSFDPISKYHISDNTPYIRYFLSEFLQFQLYEVMCGIKAEMYGIENEDFHLCDLYGLEEAGKKLRLLMSHGSMFHWDAILEEFSGGKYRKISAVPILNYFRPLIQWLQEIVLRENIPIGW